MLHCDKRYLLRGNVFLVLLFQVVSVYGELEARVSLNVDGQGFHRNLIYQMDINDIMEDCYTAVYLELPSALYVNVDELADLMKHRITTACSVGETDVELFMENAKPQNITICAPLIRDKSTLKVSIHQRYRYANKNGGYMSAKLPKPKLLVGCKNRIREHRVSKIDLCTPCIEIIPKWREIPYTMDQDDFMFLVPVGDSSISIIITYVTLFTTILGAMYITRRIQKSMPNEHQKTN